MIQLLAATAPVSVDDASPLSFVLLLAFVVLLFAGLLLMGRRS